MGQGTGAPQAMCAQVTCPLGAVEALDPPLAHSHLHFPDSLEGQGPGQQSYRVDRAWVPRSLVERRYLKGPDRKGTVMSQLPSSAFGVRNSRSHRWVKGVARPAQISLEPRPLPRWPGSAGPGLRAEPPVTAAQQGHLAWILCEGSGNSHCFKPPRPCDHLLGSCS